MCVLVDVLMPGRVTELYPMEKFGQDNKYCIYMYMVVCMQLNTVCM